MLNKIFLTFFFVLIINKPAFAYLDPGSVSLAIQAVLAVIVGGLATIKLWWSNFIGFFKKKPSQAEDKDEL